MSKFFRIAVNLTVKNMFLRSKLNIEALSSIDSRHLIESS